MADPSIYPWYYAYKSAILETDLTKVPLRIKVALKIIEDRIGSPVHLDESERQAIENARRGLATLKVETDHGNV